MAYQTINTFRIYDFEQEEIIDIQQVANPDTGVVQEVSTLVQDSIHAWIDLIVKQERIVGENKSNFRCELWANISCEEATMGEGAYLDFSYSSADKFKYNCVRCGSHDTEDEGIDNRTDLIAEVGKSNSRLIAVFDTTNTTTTDFYTYHNFNGDFTNFNEIRSIGWASGKGNTYQYNIVDFNLEGKITFVIKSSTLGNVESVEEAFENIIPSPLPIDRGLYATTAINLTDEENPSFTYVAPAAGYSCLEAQYTTQNYLKKTERLRVFNNTITSLQAALSLDGTTIDIPYRDIALDGATYTFYLTDVERDYLRQKAQGSDTVPIYYMIKVGRETGVSFDVTTSYTLVVTETQSAEAIAATKRYLTIVGCNPTLNPTVKDIKEETIALTGDENTFIRYESMAEYAINATASKQATIVTQSVTCGSKTIEGLPYGVIEDVESGTFNFYVLDSRGMAAAGSVFKNLVEYVKPTCYQKLEIELSGETGANIKLTVNGNYYNGSFGAADNTLQLEVRHTNNNGDMGAWTTLTGTPTFNGNTYKLETTLSGFNYGKAYVFQCRATDKLNFVESSQYTIRMLPVFDWSETDFNFNVPVNIEGNLDINGETVLRHNAEAKNTVLSASGGHIYIRPGGTDDTSGETTIYPDGSVKFGGTVMLANGTVVGDPTEEFADYVIETGEEAMGSNGTWYWRKWNSGKSECWGCRNFGNMAVTTAWGNLYRSAFLTQDLPDDVFARTPDVININIVNATFGGWICKHENTAPSAATTGSFIFVRPASATVTAPTYIGFHVIGEWI